MKNLIILISWGVQKSKREIENVNFKGKLFILKKKPNFMVVWNFTNLKVFFFLGGVGYVIGMVMRLLGS